MLARNSCRLVGDVLDAEDFDENPQDAKCVIHEESADGSLAPQYFVNLRQHLDARHQRGESERLLGSRRTKVATEIE